LNGRWPRALLIPLAILAWLAVVIVIGWLLSHVTRTLLMVVLATVVTFAATPVVNFGARFVPRLVALAITYVLAVLLLIALVGVVIATLAGQVSNLVHNLPAYAEQAKGAQTTIVQLLSPFGITAGQVDGVRVQLTAELEKVGAQIASDALAAVRSFLGGVVDGVLVLMLSVYLTANGPRIRSWLQAQTPTMHRRRGRLLIAIVDRVVGGYVRGTLTMALLIGLLVGVGMGVLQVRYALLLGVLAFFMAFVPILGTLVSGAVCVGVALFQSWVLALVVLAYYVVVHVIEGDVIGPRIMGAAVGIHPAVALVALLAGTELFGIWGALFGAPLAGLLQAILTAAWREIQAGAPEVVEASASKARRARST
jgi:predicted PurR-regulated permease PerM